MTAPSSQPPGSDDTPARLTRLEEHAAFAAHEAEQLAEHVRALMARIETLARRVEGLESRLRLADAAPGAGGDHPDGPDAS